MGPWDIYKALFKSRTPAKLVAELEALAAAGDVEAIGVCATIFGDGIVTKRGRVNVAKNPRSQSRYLELGCARGDADAMLVLANILTDSPRTLARGIALYKRSFRLGHSTAATNLASTYRRNQQYRLSYRWFVKAADLDDDDAAFQAALAELHGVGTRRNVPSALSRLRRVTKCKTSIWPRHWQEIDAMLEIAQVYFDGLLVKKDFARAEQWWRKAAALGSRIAKAHLDNQP